MSLKLLVSTSQSSQWEGIYRACYDVIKMPAALHAANYLKENTHLLIFYNDIQRHFSSLLPSRLRLWNTLTAFLQRDKTLAKCVLNMILNNL